MNDHCVTAECRRRKKAEKISTVYKLFTKIYAFGVDKRGKKGYIISVA